MKRDIGIYNITDDFFILCKFTDDSFLVIDADFNDIGEFCGTGNEFNDNVQKLHTHSFTRRPNNITIETYGNHMGVFCDADANRAILARLRAKISNDKLAQLKLNNRRNYEDYFYRVYDGVIYKIPKTIEVMIRSSQFAREDYLIRDIVSNCIEFYRLRFICDDIHHVIRDLMLTLRFREILRDPVAFL